MENIEKRTFKILGKIPESFASFFVDVEFFNGYFDPGDQFPFLDNFLIDAVIFWQNEKKGRLGSGLWVENNSSGNECYFEAEAIWFENRKILLFRLLERSQEDERILIQKMREKSLIYEQLVLTEKELRMARDKLEERVKERTSELNKVNLNLKQENQERKTAEKKLNESWKRISEAMEGTVRAMASLIEIKDPYTAGHQKRVANLAFVIAKEMKISENRIEGLHIAGNLHDIGKIYLPSEFLSKPGKLSRAEFDIIKTHPIIAYDILKSVKFPWKIDEIVLQHHERLNGSGYPYKLRGRKIILEARILAVADTVEAMSSHRPYRPALGIKEALEEITLNRGRLYDPKVVDACIKVFKQKKFKFT